MTTTYSFATAFAALMIGVGGTSYYFQATAAAAVQCPIAQVTPSPLPFTTPMQPRSPMPPPSAFHAMSSTGSHSY